MIPVSSPASRSPSFTLKVQSSSSVCFYSVIRLRRGSGKSLHSASHHLLSLPDPPRSSLARPDADAMEDAAPPLPRSVPSMEDAAPPLPRSMPSMEDAAPPLPRSMPSMEDAAPPLLHPEGIHTRRQILKVQIYKGRHYISPAAAAAQVIPGGGASKAAGSGPLMQQQEHDRGAGGACRPKKKNPSSTRANRLLDSTGGAGVGGDAARIARRVAAATGAGRPGVP
ncbi:hypothetical protein D1007_61274 [Hordeum vulgare]|nr:hypothetical protein D1007_61274 [Hordeum vulgare]